MRGELAAYMVIHASILSPAPGRVCWGWPTGDKVRLEPKVLRGLDSFQVNSLFFFFVSWIEFWFNLIAVQRNQKLSDYCIFQFRRNKHYKITIVCGKDHIIDLNNVW